MHDISFSFMHALHGSSLILNSILMRALYEVLMDLNNVFIVSLEANTHSDKECWFRLPRVKIIRGGRNLIRAVWCNARAPTKNAVV